MTKQVLVVTVVFLGQVLKVLVVTAVFLGQVLE